MLAATTVSRKPSAHNGNPSKTIKRKVQWLAAKYMFISQHFLYIRADYIQAARWHQSMWIFSLWTIHDLVNKRSRIRRPKRTLHLSGKARKHRPMRKPLFSTIRRSMPLSSSQEIKRTGMIPRTQDATRTGSVLPLHRDTPRIHAVTSNTLIVVPFSLFVK